MSDKKENKLAGAIGKMAHAGKGFASGIKARGETIINKLKENNSERRFNKLSPVFPDQFKSDGFNVPNVIKIVDDAERRGIKECEGAIGWLDMVSGVEILHLYDEEIDFSGLQFIPTATCDSMYYVDQHDRNRFLRTDCIFSKAHEERMAELEHIAYCLGAKKFWVEISESNSVGHSNDKSMDALISHDGAVAKAKVSKKSKKRVANGISGVSETVFKENNTLRRPELKWFAHDDTILRFIEMRLDNTSSMDFKTLVLSGESSATMTRNTAAKVDAVLSKDGGKTSKGELNLSMSTQANDEYKRAMHFYIEF